MNENIFIVCAYPSTISKLNTLKECLISLKRTGYDILLTTNYKIIDEEIYQLVDYLIYDKTDIKSFVELGVDNLGDGWTLHTEHFTVSTMFDNAYHYDIYRSTYNAISLSNSLGYNFFVYVEGDCILKDFDKIDEIKKQMFDNNKKLFFGKIFMSTPDGGGYYDYSTLLYGGIPNYYITHVDIPYDVNDWINKPYVLRKTNESCFLTNLGLEVIIYHCLQIYTDDILELDFNNSMTNIAEYNKVSKISEYASNNILYFDPKISDNSYIFLYNTSNQDIYVKLYFDDVMFLERNFCIQEWFLQDVNIQFITNKTYKIEIFINGELNSINEKKLTPEYINLLKCKHRINHH